MATPDSEQPQTSSQPEGDAAPEGIGHAAEEQGIVDQQAVLKDQIDETGADPTS